MRHPPQILALNAWSLAGGAILEGCGNVGRWGLSGGSRSQGGVFLNVKPGLQSLSVPFAMR
jgi:hypothetical protein